MSLPRPSRSHPHVTIITSLTLRSISDPSSRAPARSSRLRLSCVLISPSLGSGHTPSLSLSSPSLVRLHRRPCRRLNACRHHPTAVPWLARGSSISGRTHGPTASYDERVGAGSCILLLVMAEHSPHRHLSWYASTHQGRQTVNQLNKRSSIPSIHPAVHPSIHPSCHPAILPYIHLLDLFI